ncbi:MAG: Formylglycine-generating sulfatase enzyme [Actinobacteria bacterium ADurb.Bin444]|nr:MAG: Formylglycine-generating sulfatase enzyme [Actinobacteria bacterium ADurb.Bin444]
MAWGSEVPPGGFLLGQDGGAEGSGPSRHVNIPWSYWLSKYEITTQQYCDFLNAALVAGFVTRSGITAVHSKDDALLFRGLQGAFQLLPLGDSNDIRWNVNNFEVVGTRTNFPVRVSWYGALAFASTLAEYGTVPLVVGAVAGAIIALVAHVAQGALRSAVDGAGTERSAPFLSFFEDIAVIVGAFALLLLPWLGIPVLFFVFFLVYRVRVRRKRKYRGLRILRD